ncbi:MAG: aspartate--tRNA ligase [Firmicutes bacterium HGW-Firmicutes-16]|nr:MAG: aspartate--tRNA ligase [Firmicutes bacterium HGW-Firmicutes-16]
MMQSRTHTCNELRIEDAGEKVKIVGWMENVREVSASLAFVVIRDFYGTTQVVVETEDMIKSVREITRESTISVEGTVRERASKNPKLPTGDIEIVPEKIEVLGRCRYNELPFQINHSREADETTRLKYRYLDLRNPEVKNNIILRCNVVAALRRSMTEHGFLEITTPILTASSPEGARDYLVPARNHPGKFYALPQAPQQFKQLLMTSGFDRYFQIAPCFRDEDARADRSPGEFYQLDMEMAFANQEDVFSVLEDVLPPIFAQYGKYNIASAAPFRRIPFSDAMEIYGSDKPDLRIKLALQDATVLLSDCGFEPFAGNTVKAVVVPEFSQTRKFIDQLCADVEVQSNVKTYWFRLDENGELVGGISKFLAEKKDAVISSLGLKPNSFVGLTSGKKLAAQKSAGVLRKMLGATVPGLMDVERYEFCWIVDFPMYEIGEESGELEFCHNPFSMPNGGLNVLNKVEKKEVDPLTITAYQYDLVCNGVELSSGAVRNHDPEIMIKAFELVRMGEDDVKAKFPAMYNAFCYGAPPHAGIAPGVDRMVMLLAGEDSIREIIPFPMNKTAQDLMMGAPSVVESKQLRELHIALVEKD